MLVYQRVTRIFAGSSWILPQRVDVFCFIWMCAFSRLSAIDFAFEIFNVYAIVSPHPTIMEGQAGFLLLPAILIMQCVVPMALWISFALETLSGQDDLFEKTMAIWLYREMEEFLLAFFKGVVVPEWRWLAGAWHSSQILPIHSPGRWSWCRKSIRRNPDEDTQIADS